ncbi:PREDICTED: U3 small nucleolar RNA-associated protein 15 homolog [Priapulus caudatus]|uniref:U3 small nucleolar RNA-associated protein 15 homolog n=1 Tax=Priapulus caudatus TaxID=37621 RepID=A0ABM1FBI2_PRICU|nr:PREDICTED: U3 small nucleolar RNA-associated protein 15 homolog [Priapulus caudatus]
MAHSFKTTDISSAAQTSQNITRDTVYWKRLDPPLHVKEYAAVTSVDFSPVEPYMFAVTSSLKISLYSSVSNQVKHTISRFRETAYSGSFRNDGKLLVAGGEEKIIKLFDVANTKSLLRVFKGHTGPIHRVSFVPNTTQIASFSDDRTVRCYDIPAEREVSRFCGHADYVRAGAVNHASPNILVSGGYDHVVKMWDVRQKDCVMSVDHGHPVESVLFFPSGGIFCSAGGSVVNVWDAFGKKQLCRLMDHHKTVTCMCLSSDNHRLLTGSLDRHVKVYDVSSYKVVHSLNYSSAILSVGVAQDDKTVVVGMADGLLSIQHRRPEITKEEREETRLKKKSSYKYILQARTHLPSKGDFIVESEAKKVISKYDKHLQKFRASKALDAVLLTHHRLARPHVAVAVMQELIRRGALHAAVAGRGVDELRPLARFLARHVGDPAFAPTLVDVAGVTLDAYAARVVAGDNEMARLLRPLRRAVAREVAVMAAIPAVLGSMDAIFAAASTKSYASVEGAGVDPGGSAGGAEVGGATGGSAATRS